MWSVQGGPDPARLLSSYRGDLDTECTGGRPCDTTEQGGPPCTKGSGLRSRHPSSRCQHLGLRKQISGGHGALSRVHCSVCDTWMSRPLHTNTLAKVFLRLLET